MASSASKSLLEIPDLPVDAFRPAAGRMRLHGKSDAPDAPDYAGLAQQTAAGNLDLARAGASANRIDQTTPYGSITYTRGTGVDQGAYQRALDMYWAQQNDFYGAARDRPGGTEAAIQNAKNNGTYIDGMPQESDFVLNPDKWTSNITLDPIQQDLLNKRNYQDIYLGETGKRLSEQAIGNLGSQMNISDIPGLIYGIGDDPTGGGQWAKYSDLMMSRLNPDLDQQQAALDTKLANMGLTAGSEGWSTQQQQFGKQRNDANVAAQLAGANLALQGAQLNNTTRQQAISERADLRDLPLKELQQIRSMAGLTNPTFSQPGMQQLTAGADLSGAGQSQYGAAMNAVNAQNQQAANTTGAGIGLLAAAASFY